MSVPPGSATTTAIWFDLDGTLVEFTRPYEAVVTDALREHLGPLDGAENALTETYSEAFHATFGAVEARPYREGMAAVLDAAAGLDGPDAEGADPDAIVETLREREYAATAVDDAAREALAGLAADGRLGVLTNGVREWQLGKLDHHDLVGQFEAVVASYEAGAHKPDPAPFGLARERIPADEHVLVGDADADVEGARAAGFVPVRFEADAEPGFWETVGALS